MLESFATVIAGLGLFFAGLWFLTDNLKKLAGVKLRVALAAGIGKPWRGFAWGLIAGGLTHTTTVAVFVLVGLLAAGLTTVKAVIPVLLGVNIGTSALIFLATLDIEVVVLIVTGAAGIAIANERTAGFRPVASVVFGVGMLFVGIGMLQDGASNLVQLPWAERLLSANRDSYLLAFLAGAALRFIAQSGPAVSILAVSLSGTGVFGIEQTIMTIYGANFGAAISTWALSWGVRGQAREIAMYQVIFDVLGALILVPLFYLEVYGGVPLAKALVTVLADDVQHQMAYVYLLFNLTAALALGAGIPVLTFVGRWWRTPDHSAGATVRDSPRGVRSKSMPHTGTGSVASCPSDPNRAQTWSITMGAVACIVLVVGVTKLPRGVPEHAETLIPTLEVATVFREAQATTPIPTLTVTPPLFDLRVTGPTHPLRTHPDLGPADEAGLTSAESRGSEDDILALLEHADDDFAALRLATPPGNCAWDRFKAVLSRDPGNARAQQGLQRIVARYVDLAKDATAAGRPHRAATYLSRARLVLFGLQEARASIAGSART